MRKFVLNKVAVERVSLFCCLRKAVFARRDVHTVISGKIDLTRANR